MLKAQIHMHAKGDPEDAYLTYTPKQAIDRAAELNFDVLAFTFHNTLFYNEEIVNYAKSKGILLIPGIERTIEGSHILILGLEKIPEINKVSELKKLNGEALVIAPHPFFPRTFFYSLQEKCIEHIDLFDGIEHSYFYTKRVFNYNKKAIEVAKKYNKPMVGTSDIHNLICLNDTYILIDSKKNIKDIINAIKNNKFKTITKRIPLWKFYYIPTNIMFKTLLHGDFRKLFQLLTKK